MLFTGEVEGRKCSNFEKLEWLGNRVRTSNSPDKLLAQARALRELIGTIQRDLSERGLRPVATTASAWSNHPDLH